MLAYTPDTKQGTSLRVQAGLEEDTRLRLDRRASLVGVCGCGGGVFSPFTKNFLVELEKVRPNYNESGDKEKNHCIIK